MADEELVADMIYNFVLPEIEKHNMREKIHDQQQSYMRNACISIYEKILDLPPDESLQVTDQEVYVKNEDIQAIHVAEDMVKIDDFSISRHISCKNIHLFFKERDIKTEEIELPTYETDIEDKKRANSEIDSETNSQSSSSLTEA